jgi:hypothetical protein
MYSTKIREKSIGMKRHMHLLPFFRVAAAAFILAFAAPELWAGDEDDWDEIPFAEANIFFELNNTDGDLGIHALIDGEAWKRLEIEGPKERELLDIRVKGRLRRQGLTEIFFESAEPSFDELKPKRFFRRFPEGKYEIEGLTLDGYELESTAEVTHLLPAPPKNIKVSGIPAAENCDAEELPSVDGSKPVIITWEPVTTSHPELGRTDEVIEVVKYQVVAEREEPTLLIFSIDLPPTVTEIQIPAGFIALGQEFKFEILVREASGNQTAVESCFEIN